VEGWVYGLLNASTPRDPEVPNAKAGAVTRFNSGAGTGTWTISNAFGNAQASPLPDGFMGIYYDTTTQKYFLVTWVNSLGVWKKAELIGP
jgi:hypothetical protein